MKWALFLHCGLICTLLFSAKICLADDGDQILKTSAYGDKTVWSYSADTPLPWILFKPNDFAAMHVPFNSIGVRSVGQVPPPGVHPRIFFSPQDLPAIRYRLKNTTAGQAAWKNVLAYSNALRQTYDENADYAKPDWMAGSFNEHGRVPLYLVGGYDNNREDFYSVLASGNKPAHNYDGFLPLASVEAFRCLIDNDGPSAQTLARAVVTAVKFEQDRRAREDKPVQPGQPPNPSSSRYAYCECLAFVYDFIYNWMSDDQKKIIHDELVTVSAWHDNYGTFNNAYSSRSNWATFSYWVYDLLAIEGEPGFNDLKFRGLYRGWRNFITVSYFKSGAIFEGEGKSLLGMDAVVAFDRLAPKYGLRLLSQHPAIRNHFDNFTVNSILPSQDKFVLFDVLGGMGADTVCTPIDVVVAHYLYPDDKRLDYLYRVIVKDDYRTLPNRCDWLWNTVIMSAVFATDYDSANTPETLHLPNTFFCGQRAMMMTKSSWDKDATFLTMQVRGASGGHPYRDRNGIMLAAEGRSWVTIPWSGGEDAAWKCDTVIIDGREQSNTSPGRVVDFVDSPYATFLVGDAKYCWDWVWKTTNKTKDGKPASLKDVEDGNLDVGASWKPVDLSFNDFAWTKAPTPVYMRPLKFCPDWLAVNGVISSYVKQPNTPVIKSFRTAGLIRGKRPYVLLIDDIQRDCLPARYDWNLTLYDDIMQVSSNLLGTQPGDIVLAGKESISDGGNLKTGDPALLIRLLACSGSSPTISLGVRDNVNLLSITTLAISPNFKVLIYPFRSGDTLPATRWNKSHSAAIVSFPGQIDRISFAMSTSGKTNVFIVRDGKQIASVDRPVARLVDTDSDQLDQGLSKMSTDIKTIGTFNPNTIPGEIASWPLRIITADQLPASQVHVPAIDAANCMSEPGPYGDGVRLPITGVRVPMDLKGKLDNGFTVQLWTKSDSNPTGTLINLNDLLGMGLNLVQGSLRLDTQKQWFFGGTISAETLGGWTQFAVTWDGQTVTLYRDGLALMSQAGTKKPEINDSFTLGGDGYNGLFADLRIYNHGLDPGTIKKMYILGRISK